MARTRSGAWMPFTAGVLAGSAAALALARVLVPRRRVVDPRLVKGRHRHVQHPTAVIVPGILGSGLVRPDGTPVWLNVRNAVGQYDLTLPFRLPLGESGDDLAPKGLLGTQARVPRLFGFTEYYDLLELLASAGFAPYAPGADQPLAYHVFAYDWRRDLVDSARRLHATLEELADLQGDPEASFDVVGHSMGGLVARYYLRYGTAEPGGPVTWAGAPRIRNLIMVAVPNGGGLHALDVLLNGARVGLSYTTLSAEVVSRMPAAYQLLPPIPSLLDAKGDLLDASLHDTATWERHRWGPFAPTDGLRAGGGEADREARRAFLDAVLARARDLHEALARMPDTPCPARVALIGGETLPTLARAIVSDRPGDSPRFVSSVPAEAEAMFEAGDGRVTRASMLAAHLPGADEDEHGCGVPEVSRIFLGAADHHGIYADPTFQTVLLRQLLKPHRRRETAKVG